MKCPNCGRRSLKNFCPDCGTNLAEVRTSQQMSEEGQNSADFHGQGDNYRGTTKSSDYFFGGPLADDNQEESAGRLPIDKFLWKIAKSPMVFCVALLATVYAGCTCYTNGITIFDLLGIIFGRNFDFNSTLEKISCIVLLIVCFVHLAMAVWLSVATWSLFSSAAGRRKASMPFYGLNCLRAYARFGKLIYKALTLSAFTTLGFTIIWKYSSSRDCSDFVREFSHGAAQLTSSGITQAGLGHIAVSVFEEDIYRALFSCVAFIFGAIRYSLLDKVLAVSDSMIRFGDISRSRVPPVASMTLISGLVIGTSTVFAFLKLGTGRDAILSFGPFAILSLILILCAVILEIYTIGVRRRQF